MVEHVETTCRARSDGWFRQRDRFDVSWSRDAESAKVDEALAVELVLAAAVGHA